MENKYWIGRKRSALAMAHGALSAEARLIHYDLAGRYSVKAAHSQMPAPMRTEPEAAPANARAAPGANMPTPVESQPIPGRGDGS